MVSHMGVSEKGAMALRARLDEMLSSGLARDPAAHAGQVAAVLGVLNEAFGNHGFTVTLVGGSAIEVHAPGIYMSGDIDVVIEGGAAASVDRDDVFQSLGFGRVGRHWRRDELFVETVPGPLAGPADEVEVAGAVFRVVRKEVLLRDRIVGFKHWRHTAYGDQAIAMLIAFDRDLDEEWLQKELAREGAEDALVALRNVARSGASVTHEGLLAIIDDLHGQKRQSGPTPQDGHEGANEGKSG
jgi:hypothetical protein